MRHPNFEDARPLIEAEIERLIDVLDLLEPNPDLEENADWEPNTGDEEPSIGAPEALADSWEGLRHQNDVDCELDDSDLEESFADEAVPRNAGVKTGTKKAA